MVPVHLSLATIDLSDFFLYVPMINHMCHAYSSAETFRIEETIMDFVTVPTPFFFSIMMCFIS